MANLKEAKRYLEHLRKYIVEAHPGTIEPSLVAMGIDTILTLVTREIEVGSLTCSASANTVVPTELPKRKEYVDRWNNPLINPATIGDIKSEK